MFDFALPTQTSLRQAVTDAYRRDEVEAVQDMLERAQMSQDERTAADRLAPPPPARKGFAVLADNGVVSIRHTADEIIKEILNKVK